MTREEFTSELRRLTTHRNARVGGRAKVTVKRSTWCTYFIQKGMRGPVKIGRTHDVAQRLASLQTGSEAPLYVIGVIDGDHEARLHHRFRRWRRSGEWFAPAVEILDMAKSSVFTPMKTMHKHDTGITLPNPAKPMAIV